MPKKKTDPKSTPGLVPIRLQLTPDERERLRAIASKARKPMAIWCRETVLAAMKRAEKG